MEYLNAMKEATLKGFIEKMRGKLQKRKSPSPNLWMPCDWIEGDEKNLIYSKRMRSELN